MASKEPTKKPEKVLVNPVTSKNTGSIFPIFLALVVASIAWIFIDPELRRGLSSYTGIGYVPDVLEELVTKEYTIKLHGSYLSTCSQRVLVVAKEKELEVNMHVVNTAAKEHKTPDFLHTYNPFGQIPVLELVDEGKFVYESRAIASYLEKRYPTRGTSFAVHGNWEQTIYDEALSIEAFSYDPPASAIFKEAVMKPRLGGVPNPDVIAAGKALLASKLDAYESILSTRPYLAGHNMTLADLYHLPYGQKIIDAGHGEALMDHTARPHVAKWWKSLSDRPSWKAVLHDVEQWQEAQRKEQEERERKEEEEKEKEKHKHKHKH